MKTSRKASSCQCTPTPLPSVLLKGRGYNVGSNSGGRSSLYPANCDSDHQHYATPLLGTYSQLCTAFFHAAAPTSMCCLDPGQCIRAATTVIVLRATFDTSKKSDCSNDSPQPFIARYHSCWRGYSNSVHAEQFLINDERLTDALNEHDGDTTLELFMSQQPCHFSTGRYANRKVTGKTSCTERLLEWMKQLNATHNNTITLNIWLANIFRAYQPERTAATLSTKEAKIFTERSTNAKNGLVHLLETKNIMVQMINESGWKFLFSLASPSNDETQDNSTKTNDTNINVRLAMDEEKDLFLCSLR